MSIPFGPQLIGQTEKTLNALLERFLDGTGLTEPQWVALRVADQLDGGVDGDGLATEIAHRAHISNATELVGVLTDRGLLDDGRLTAAGREVGAGVQTKVARQTTQILDGLADDDVAATTRVLNEILMRANAALASPS